MELAIAKTFEKITGRFARAVQMFFGPKLTMKQADADSYAIERAIEICEKNPGYNISCKDGRLNFSECTPEELIARAKNRALADAIRKRSNCERVLMLAANEAQQSESVDEPLDEDWFTRFFDIVGDVSSEDMQLVWSKILAGEIKQPGKFSLRTLETIRNVSKSEAEMFQKVVPLIMQSKSVSTARNFISSEAAILNKYGVSYEMVLRLGECGLLSTSESSLWHLVSNRKTAMICNDEKMIIMFGVNDFEVKISHGVYMITNVGSELYSILEHGYNDDYIHDLAQQVCASNNGNVKVIISDVSSLQS